MNNLIYGINDKPKKLKEWLLYSLQQVLSVFVATVLIANVCGTPVSSCLLGACFGTLIYQIITKFKSPAFISSCGSMCSAVIGALALPGVSNQNYLMVTIGGLVVLVIYALFALIVKLFGKQVIDKLFPPVVIGPIVMLIGLNLAGFIPGYLGFDSGASSEVLTYSTLVALATAVITAITSRYAKGFLKTIPFLIGLLFGYFVCIILTLTGVCELVDFSMFKEPFSWYPDLTFLKWNWQDFSWSNVLNVFLLFGPVSICALLEHYSDHKCLSNIVGTDLTKEPGLHKTLLGDGVASFAGTMICGLPNTSYGESVATTGFSKVASTYVITLAACVLGLLSFIGPVQVLIQSIPSCVFGGCAMILYGYISCSGLKTIMNAKIDYEDNRNLVVTSVILTIGISGIYLFTSALTGISLALIVGVILNLMLKGKREVH
jgi:uracil permease